LEFSDYYSDMLNLSNDQTIGMLFTIFGLAFTSLGVLLFFDPGLIALGNMLFLCGMVFLIGFMKTVSFFTQAQNWAASLCFLGGFVLVVLGFSFFGLILECVGFVKLFGGFFPYVVVTIRGIPIIGRILDIPPFKQVADYILAGHNTLPV